MARQRVLIHGKRMIPLYDPMKPFFIGWLTGVFSILVPLMIFGGN